MNLRRLLIVLGLFVFAFQSHAGERVGNGGGAWMCTAGGKPQWLQMVDAYEAETQFHLTISRASDTPENLARAAIAKLSGTDPQYARDLSGWLDTVLSKVSFVKAELRIVDDFLYYIKPYDSECPGGTVQYVQAANFTTDGEILFRKDIFDGFTDTMKAALYVHEAVYADLRAKYGEANSIRARHLTALLISTLTGDDLQSQIDSILGSTPVPTAPRKMKFIKIPKGVYSIGGPGAWRSYSIDQDIEMTETPITEWQVVQYGAFISDRQDLCPQNYIEVHPGNGYCPNRPEDVALDRSSYGAFASKVAAADSSGRYTYRLPSVEEWEVAARAGTQTTFFFGDDASQIDRYAVVSSSRINRNSWSDVATKQANAWGFYDMIGNFTDAAITNDGFLKSMGCNFRETDYSNCVNFARMMKQSPMTTNTMRLVRVRN